MIIYKFNYNMCGIFNDNRFNNTHKWLYKEKLAYYTLENNYISLALYFY